MLRLPIPVRSLPARFRGSRLDQVMGGEIAFVTGPNGEVIEFRLATVESRL
jgi:hypothetical protein